MKYAIVFLLVIFSLSACQSEKPQAEKRANTSSAKAEHRCANCGMITSNYPKWEEKVILAGGDTLYFDGPRCMFFTLLNTDKPIGEVSAVMVKDYYTLDYIDGKNAYYVIGSDVMGPMGKELIPCASEEAAKEFKTDHKAQRILRFDEVTLDLIKQLAGKMKM